MVVIVYEFACFCVNKVYEYGCLCMGKVYKFGSLCVGIVYVIGRLCLGLVYDFAKYSVCLRLYFLFVFFIRILSYTVFQFQA